MAWLRSVDDDICGACGYRILSKGSKYDPRAYPCIITNEDGKEMGRCECLQREYAGRLCVMILCNYKGDDEQI